MPMPDAEPRQEDAAEALQRQIAVLVRDAVADALKRQGDTPRRLDDFATDNGIAPGTMRQIHQRRLGPPTFHVGRVLYVEPRAGRQWLQEIAAAGGVALSGKRLAADAGQSPSPVATPTPGRKPRKLRQRHASSDQPLTAESTASPEP